MNVRQYILELTVSRGSDLHKKQNRELALLKIRGAIKFIKAAEIEAKKMYKDGDYKALGDYFTNRNRIHDRAMKMCTTDEKKFLNLNRTIFHNKYYEIAYGIDDYKPLKFYDPFQSEEDQFKEGKATLKTLYKKTLSGLEKLKKIFLKYEKKIEKAPKTNEGEFAVRMSSDPFVKELEKETSRNAPYRGSNL